jgi:hypothetical protein
MSPPNQKTDRIQMPGTNNVNKLEELAARLQEDIVLAKSREEHIRLTARANEAAAIALEMKTASAAS